MGVSKVICGLLTTWGGLVLHVVEWPTFLNRKIKFPNENKSSQIFKINLNVNCVKTPIFCVYMCLRETWQSNPNIIK